MGHMYNTTENLVSVPLNTVTGRLKAGIVEADETSTSRQRIGKQVSAAKDTQATIKKLLENIWNPQLDSNRQRDLYLVPLPKERRIC
jgi:hypothetical protein